MASGLPLIATRLALRGMGEGALTLAGVIVADAPEDFARTLGEAARKKRGARRDARPAPPGLITTRISRRRLTSGIWKDWSRRCWREDSRFSRASERAAVLDRRHETPIKHDGITDGGASARRRPRRWNQVLWWWDGDGDGGDDDDDDGGDDGGGAHRFCRAWFFPARFSAGAAFAGAAPVCAVAAIGAKATAAVTNIAMRILFTIFTSYEIRLTHDKRGKHEIAERVYTNRAWRTIRLIDLKSS